MRDDLALIERAQFPWPDRVFHLFIGGSELHGAKLHGTDDHDIYGLYIEPPMWTLGLDRHEHFVWSTSGNHLRNVAGDVDITLYSLRKWAGLACKGNPTALHFPFAPNRVPDNPTYLGLIAHRLDFLARSHINQFIGFVDALLKRMTGERGRGKKGQRPELESKHGYDVKAGMHAIRLLHEAIELMREQRITLPRPEKDLLIRIRQGEWSLDRLLKEAYELISTAKLEAEASSLPANINREKISALVTNLYLEAYGLPKRSLG